MSVTGRLVKRFNGTSWDIVRPVTQMDSVTRHTLYELGKISAWQQANGAAVMVGEVGWGNDANFTGDAAKWNAVADQWMRQADLLGIDWQYWSGGPTVGVGPLNVYWADTNGGTINHAGTQDATLEAHYGTGTTRRGVNISSIYANAVTNDGGSAALLPSNSQRFNSGNPGTAGTDYWYPQAADFTYLAARGVRAVSLRVRWERLQPTLGAALNSTELGRLQACITAATNAGIKVVVCLHNGWGYLLANSSVQGWDTCPISQNGSVTVAHFVDLWTRLSTALAGTVFAYDLLNEPRMPSAGNVTGSELVTNGSFDTNLSGWSIGGTPTWTSSQAHTGAGSAQVVSTGTLATGTSTTFSVTAGTAYQVSGFFKAGGSYATEFPSVGVAFYDSTSTLIASVKSSGTIQSAVQFKTTSLATVAPVGAVTAAAQFFVRAAGAGETVYVDDISVKACTNPLSDIALWQYASQQAVNAVRGTGDTSTELWVQFGEGATIPALDNETPWVTDTANKFRYCIHHYWDDANGHATYTSSYATENTYQQAAGF